ncbi:MAG: hypothetical protein AABY22_14040 [Nanoarchaeota archaeon]
MSEKLANKAVKKQLQNDTLREFENFQKFRELERNKKENPPDREILEFNKWNTRLSWEQKWLRLREVESQIKDDNIIERDDKKINNSMTPETLILVANECKFNIENMRYSILQMNKDSDENFRLKITEKELDEWRDNILKLRDGYKFLT